MQSAAVYLLHRLVRKCSSSVLEQTLQNAYLCDQRWCGCKSKQQVGPAYKPITSEYLDYDEVMEKYDIMMDWLADLYVNTLKLIQYMHDKYYYEAC